MSTVSNAPTPESAGGIPEWTLGDRLAKARKAAKRSVGATAEYFDVHPKTINNYENDRTQPSRAVLLQWALWTGADATWLATGVIPTSPPSPTGGLISGTSESACNRSPQATVVPLRRLAA